MPTIEVSAFYIRCDGPGSVPWEDHCEAKYPLSYDKGELETEAQGNGWKFDGRKRFCPQHAPEDAPADKPARKARVVDTGAAE